MIPLYITQTQQNQSKNRQKYSLLLKINKLEDEEMRRDGGETGDCYFYFIPGMRGCGVETRRAKFTWMALPGPGSALVFF